MQTETPNKKGFRFSGTVIATLALFLLLSLAACSSNSTRSDTGDAVNNNISAEDKDANTDNEQSDQNDSAEDNDANTGDEQSDQDGESIVIPISEISETASFYPVTVDGTSMEVVAVTAPDGTIRTAFNTCQVCNGSPKAYFEQSGDMLECQNCGNKFPMNRVGIEAGGCNPVPIFDEDKTVTDESITVSYDTLQANAYRFPSNWKK